MVKPTDRLLSLIIPVYNETSVLGSLRSRLETVAASLSIPTEWVIVDDGSIDGSREWVLKWASEEIRVRAVFLAGNHGKELALLAGLDAARGSCVAILDADLQDPPELLPQMLELSDSGQFPIVAAKYKPGAQIGWFKRSTAALFYRLFALLPGFPRQGWILDSNDFRLMTRVTVDTLRLCRDRRPFLRARVAALRLPTAIVTYERPGRLAGESKYPLRRMLALAVDAIFSSTTTPQMCAWVFFGVLSFLSIAGIAVSIVWAERRFELFVLTGFVGVQSVFAGLIALQLEFSFRTLDQLRYRDAYVVAEESPVIPSLAISSQRRPRAA